MATIKNPRTTSANKVAAKTAGTATSVDELTAAKRKALFRALDNVLREHNVQGRTQSLILDDAPRGLPSGNTSPLLSNVMAIAASRCPAGMIPRIVCRRLPNGSVVCEERCTPE